MRQQIELDRLTISKGKRSSNGIKLHQDTAVLTVFTPPVRGDVPFEIEVSAEDERYVPLFHKSQPVRVYGGRAYNLPIPACKALRVSMLSAAQEDLVFHALFLLEM